MNMLPVALLAALGAALFNALAAVPRHGAAKRLGTGETLPPIRLIELLRQPSPPRSPSSPSGIRW
ncbi:MAG: hypothetical protein GEV03_07470 [Streptosporangiales bacterium]|nr:hypothetical protein [Streptosporangiales bacterium]